MPRNLSFFISLPSSLSTMESHMETEERLRSKIQKLVKVNEGLEKELQSLQQESFQRFERFRSDFLSKVYEIKHLRERCSVLLEEEWEPWFRSLDEMQKLAERRLREANMELEARRQAEVLKSEAWRAVTAMARRTVARLYKKKMGGSDEDEEIEEEKGVRKMVQPFAEALALIERVFVGKEEEMKMLRRRMEEVLSGKAGGEEMDFVDVGAFLSADGGSTWID